MRKSLLFVMVLVIGLTSLSFMFNPTSDNAKAEIDVIYFTELKTLNYHSAGVNSVSWSPDGMKIVSGSNDTTVKVLDYINEIELWNLTGHGDSVQSVSWSPNGSKLASGSSDNIIKIWDYSIGINEKNLTGHSDSVRSVEWSPNGTKLASGSLDNHIMIWDYASGIMEKDIIGEPFGIDSVKWSPNGTQIAAGNANGTIQIWEYSTGYIIKNLTKALITPIYSVVWSPDGSKLASSHQDGTIIIWDYASGMNLTTFFGHSGAALSLDWSFDSKYLVSGSEDNSIKIWNVSSGSCDKTLSGHSDFVNSVSWSPDGKKIVSGSNDNTIKIWGLGPELMVTTSDIWFTYPPLGPTENDTVMIHTRVHNNGGKDVFPNPALSVEYWIGDIAGPVSLLGYGNISGVLADDYAESTFTWNSTTPPGTYYIWVIVDSNDLVAEQNESNNEASNSIYIKKYPDITPIGVDFKVDGTPVTSVLDGTFVNITVTVQNIGETHAEIVIVQFFDGDPDLGGTQIGSSQLISIIGAYGGVGEANVSWTSTVIGKQELHSIFVVVGGVSENYLENNKISADIWVNSRPILSVLDISLSDETPFEGENLQIYASIINSGGTNTTIFSVAIYDGDPNSGGILIDGFKSLDLEVDEIGMVNVTWVFPTRGNHEIFVVADVFDDIDESDETNNEASDFVLVYSPNDIIVNNSSTPSNIGDKGSPEPLEPQHRGYILVEEDGELYITNTLLKILESVDYEFNIIVRDSGSLVLEYGSMLFTNGPPMKILLYDNATLIIENSYINSTVIEITAFDNAKIFIDESIIESDLKVDSPSANVQIIATNSSLTKEFIHFGGTSHAVFTNVTTPEALVSDSAELKVYQWLQVYVKDGAGTGIDASNVNVTELFSGNEIVGSPKITNQDGLALLDVMTDIYTSSFVISTLTYTISAEYVYDTILYITDKSVSFTSYLDDKINNVLMVELFFYDLKPDFIVNYSSVKLYKDGIERYTIGVGEKITIEGTVWNVGTSGTTEATQVVVRFYHKIDGDFVELGEDIIDTPMESKTGSGIASIVWIPQDSEVGNNEEIWITVDPDNDIPELTESQDNTDFTTVNIIRPPDLEIESIKFNTDNSQDIDNTTESVIVEIVTVIANNGADNPALSIDVMVFDGFPDFDGDMKPDSVLPTGVDMIGSVMISSLAPRTSQNIVITWDTTRKAGGYTIYVYAIEAESENYVSDTNLSNNNASESFTVFPKPDIRSEIIPPSVESIEAMDKNGTKLSADLLIGQVVLLKTTIYNNGYFSIPSIDVIFYDGNPESGGFQIGNKITVSLLPQSYENVTLEWIVMGRNEIKDIFVMVNPDHEIIESDYTNNIWSNQFTLEYADLEIILDPLDSESFAFVSKISVYGIIQFQEREIGVAGMDVTLRLLDESNNQYGSDLITKTSSNGSFEFEFPAPGQEGFYLIEIQVRQDDGASGYSTYTSQIEIYAEDGDGYIGEDDDFPNNPDEWRDSDGDGEGDNSDFLPDFNNIVFFTLLIFSITVFIIAFLYFMNRKWTSYGHSDVEEGRTPEIEPDAQDLEEEMQVPDEEDSE
jgi:WD40 repeat protein